MQCVTFKYLGILLLYPEASWVNKIDDIATIIKNENILKKKHFGAVMELIGILKKTPLLQLQESYVGWFDRTPPLSLYLFEHVHGESRDRGQAMVDLQYRYEEIGLKIQQKELPDYIPLFLEYLSHFELSKGKSLLAEPINILTVLALRLKKHDCYYHKLLDALVSLSHFKARKEVVEKAMQRDNTHELDNVEKQWEEPPAFDGIQSAIRGK